MAADKCHPLWGWSFTHNPMKIYPRILLNTLPLILLGLLIVGGLNYYLSQSALTNLAEKWLATKLADAIRMASEDVAVLHKYGLDNITANIIKAQSHAGAAIGEIAIGDSGYLWIVNDHGRVVMHPDASLMGTSMADTAWFMEMRGRLNGKSHHFSDNQKMLAVYEYFSPWNWYIMASAPHSELYGEADQMRAYMLGAGFVALMVTAIVLMILARRLTAPLNMLAKEAERIERGDHRQVARLDRGDEIGTLSTAISSMTEQLSLRIAHEQLVSDISRQFIHLSSENIDDAFQDALQKIGEYTDADRCYVGEFSLDDRLVGQTYEWCRQGVIPQTDNMIGHSLDALPWFMQRMENEGFILAASVADLPQEAAVEKKLWRARGVQSVARVPMTYGGELRGFVGLDASYGLRPWSHDIVVFLKHVGEIFCNTLERQWYQETLAAEKERLAVTLQSIGDGVITTDVDGHVVLINRVGELLTGWRQADAADQPIDDVFTVIDENTRDKQADPITNVLNTDQTASVPTQSILISSEGHERLIASSVAPIFKRQGESMGLVLVFRDITEKRRMQEELIKVEKLESIGVLAGGIAHDFNNILTAIIGNIALTKRDAAADSKIVAKMEEIETASFRARDLTQQLLTFSKGGEPVKKALSFDRLFYNSAMFSLGGSTTGLEYTPPNHIWTVEADEGQLSQVINNLVINAVQAMPEGGVIRAKMENITLPAVSPLPLEAGDYVKLSLQDYGSGISRADLSRIFDPFFTTKEEGSGLGLATAYSIVEKHGGYITVDSQLGKGTLFSLYLPASEKELLAGPPAEAVVDEGRGTGRILVMDDEEIIRDVVGSILKTFGYQVAFAKDGQEMLDQYQEALNNGSPFAAVLMDLTVPGGMGGKEAIQRLLKIDAKAKAIVSSGYSNDPVMADFTRYGFMGAVSKPYKIEDLCIAVSKVIASE